MFEKLFGNAVIEKILFYLIKNEYTYGSQLAKELDLPLFSAQKALIRLEAGGILVAQNQGKTRVFCFNPRYPFLKELKLLISRGYEFLPKDVRLRIYEAPKRRRPRRTGKPLR